MKKSNDIEHADGSAESQFPALFPQAMQISKTDINQLPLVKYGGRICIVNTSEAQELALKKLKNEKAIGFDTESRPAFNKGESYLPSIVQLATENEVYLFQILQIGGIEGISTLLSDPNIIKAGVALHEDIRRLKQFSDFNEAGFVDIVEVAKPHGIISSGLRSLVGLVFGQRISKGAQISNWARHNLTHSQIVYAATDAWVSRRLYMKLSDSLQ